MIDEIQTAIRRQGVEIKDSKTDKTVITYTEDTYEEAVAKADALRKEGKAAVLIRNAN